VSKTKIMKAVAAMIWYRYELSSLIF